MGICLLITIEKNTIIYKYVFSVTQSLVIVIDFKNPDNNDYLAVKEMKIHGDIYRRRTDIVGFVNGIPLLFIELKKNSIDVQNAYTDNYTDYLDTIPHQMIIL